MNELNIDTVLFDWGGVFQRTVDYTPRQALADELQIDEPTLEKRVFSHPALVQASQGLLAADIAWKRVTEDLGIYDVPLFLQRFFAGDRIDQQLVELVTWLRAHGMKVGLLSNAPASITTSQGIAGRWGMAGLFDAQVFSYEVGEFKPHPQAFKAALAALGASAEQTVFVDDFIENIQGAKAVGFSALLFTNTAQLLADLRQLGICVPELNELS
ncbi:MAG: HAD family hydrolase [Anaerolineae bacterium]